MTEEKTTLEEMMLSKKAFFEEAYRATVKTEIEYVRQVEKIKNDIDLLRQKIEQYNKLATLQMLGLYGIELWQTFDICHKDVFPPYETLEGQFTLVDAEMTYNSSDYFVFDLLPNEGKMKVRFVEVSEQSLKEFFNLK